MSRKGWVSEPEPWQCRRLRWHKWEQTITGAKLCKRKGCLEVRAKQRFERLPDLEAHEDYWVIVTSPDDVVLYSGPLPVPPEFARSPTDDGRFNTYECMLLTFDESADA